MAIIELTPEQRQALEAWASSGLERYDRRARILLLYAQGHTTGEISPMVSLSKGRVRFWRHRYSLIGMNIFPEFLPPTAGVTLQAVQPTPENVVLSLIAPVEGGIETSPPSKKTASPADKMEHKPARKARRKPRRGGKQSLAEQPQAIRIKLPFPQPTSKPGLQPDNSMAEAGRKVLCFHFVEMLAHEEGTRLGINIEELHDMRVATRRMRAAFDIFQPAYEPKTIKPFMRGLKATGRLLGSVRDLDVFMEKAEHYLAGLSDGGQGGLDPLLDEWHAQRTAARDRMLQHLDSPEFEDFKQEFNLFLQTAGAGAASTSERPGEPLPFSQEAVRFAVPVLIYTRLSTVRAYDQILENASIQQLHALRIEFKRLRYLLEFFSEVLGEEARQVVNEIKGLQDHLGDLHDADVACQILNQFLEGWDTRQASRSLQERQNPEPIVAYLGARYAERHHLLVSFPSEWQKFNRPELRRDLAQAIAPL